MDDGILSLKWNNHNSTFVHTLSSLHKLELYSDVTLACDGKYFPVHKFVLSICSEYFEEILARTKCQHPVVVLKDIKHSDLEALLSYMYAGEANVAQSDLANLIKAAECLRIKGLAVPDEAPPRDKKRQIDLNNSPHINKRRRNEGISNSHHLTSKEVEAIESNERLSEDTRSKRRHDSGLHIEEQYPRRDNRPISNDESESYSGIPEVILEGHPIEVKQELEEPKIEPDDSKHSLGNTSLDLEYNPINLGEEDGTSNESGMHGQESQSSHLLHDIMAQSIPGPSGVQGQESLASWDSGTNNLQGYNVENYSSDENRSQQLDKIRERTLQHSFRAKSYLVSNTSGLNPVSPPKSALLPRPWKCPFEYCGYVADRESAITKHIRKHTGEKPFSCPYCPYTSAQKSNLNCHIKVKHLKPVQLFEPPLHQQQQQQQHLQQQQHFKPI